MDPCIVTMLNVDISPGFTADCLVEIVGGEDVVLMLDQRFNQGRSLRDIATLNGISHEAVRQQINRACVRLRRILRKHGQELPWDGVGIKDEAVS